jgi:hypothetical protein
MRTQFELLRDVSTVVNLTHCDEAVERMKKMVPNG